MCTSDLKDFNSIRCDPSLLIKVVGQVVNTPSPPNRRCLVTSLDLEIDTIQCLTLNSTSIELSMTNNTLPLNSECLVRIAIQIAREVKIKMESGSMKYMRNGMRNIVDGN